MAKSLDELLKRFGHAARCGKCKTCQQKAQQLWRELKPLLSLDKQTDLCIAWTHATQAEKDPAELDALIAKLRGQLS